MSAVDVEGLFKQFTIKEIREIEKRAKGDVEQKKEDLRQMVGRRYRDIIDAADTIVTSIREVQASCDRLQALQSQMAITQQTSASKIPTIDGTTSLNAQIKLLSEIQELILECIEDTEVANVLEASFLLDLGEHLYNKLCLHLPAEENGAPSVRRRLIDELWPALSHMRAVIIQASKDILSNSGLLDGLEHTHNALCAILVLESCSVSDTLNVLLECRYKAMVDCVGVEDSSREQMCVCVRIVQRTVAHVHSLYTNLPSRFVQRVQHILSPHFTSPVYESYLDCQMRAFTCYLPADVRNHTMRISVAIEDMEKDVVSTRVSQFLHKCVELCQKECVSRLEYCESMDSLSALKQSILTTIDMGIDEWRVACRQLLDDQLSLWDMAFSVIVRNRLEHICKDSIESLVSQLKTSLHRPDLHITTELCAFVWERELISDVPSTLSPHLSTLPLKARGLAPQVFQLVDRVNEGLSVMHKQIEGHMKLNAHADASAAQQTYSNLADYLLASVEQIRNWIVQDVEDVRRKTETGGVISLGLLESCQRYWQLCSCLCEMCPQLKQMLSTQTSSTTTRRLQDAPKWAAAREHLQHAILVSLKLWLEQRVIVAERVCGAESLGERAWSDWLGELCQWDSVDIQEESSSSQLHFPVHCSTYMHLFLAHINTSLLSIAAYRIPKPAHQHLLLFASGRLLKLLSELVGVCIGNKESLPHRIPVQLLFDVKFVSAIIVSKLKDDKIGQMASQLTNQLESVIDPFDLDLVGPHLKKNVNKLIGKSLTLYGAVILPEVSVNLSRSLGVKSGSGSDSAQTMPLSQCTTRLQLLPISSSNPTSTLVTQPLGPSPLKDPATPFKTHKTSTAGLSSFYDKISTSWFGM